ncbi:MAG: DUF2147 domain-containing protein [Kiritimatiellae bacterium]|nr:DUF2147 domain-containing protein [Kiritimatiellia bacterium]
MNYLIKSFICIAAVSVATAVSAKEFIGCWTTIDDETKEQKSVVEITVDNGVYSGKIVHLFKNEDAVAKLPGSPKILGLKIISDMKRGGKGLNGGKITDPKKGKTYSCEIWRDGENLVVRGKIAFLGRNQTWLPSEKREAKK